MKFLPELEDVKKDRGRGKIPGTAGKLRDAVGFYNTH